MTFLVFKLRGAYGELRGTIHDNMQVFSVYDFIRKACGVKAKKALQSFRAKYAKEMSGLIYTCKLLGSGATPCTTIFDLLALMEKLDDKVSPAFIKKNYQHMDSYLACNWSMCFMICSSVNISPGHGDSRVQGSNDVIGDKH